jgi:hypothetical protein
MFLAADPTKVGTLHCSAGTSYLMVTAPQARGDRFRNFEAAQEISVSLLDDCICNDAGLSAYLLDRIPGTLTRRGTWGASVRFAAQPRRAREVDGGPSFPLSLRLLQVPPGVQWLIKDNRVTAQFGTHDLELMHHLGPFLIVLAWPGSAIRRAMPAPLGRLVDNRHLLRVLWWVQQPIVGGLLFVGLIDLWLIPAVHFTAMIDHRLYFVMNFSMVADGLLFWCLVLDPRPSPPARFSFAVRMITVVAVMFPQIILGSYIAFTSTDLYTFYDLCGRLFPSMGALNDQHLGGLIVWIPASMMSSAAFMLILNNVRRHEESLPPPELPEAEHRIVALSSGWTGR